jgi:hypothetical protein
MPRRDHLLGERDHDRAAAILMVLLAVFAVEVAWLCRC